MSSHRVRRTLTKSTLGSLTAAALAAGMLFAAAPPSMAASSTDAQAEKSILLVGVAWSGDVEYPTTSGTWKWSKITQAQTLCTGWFAGTGGQIVTAGHCVDPQEGRKAVIRQFLADNNASDQLATAVANWKTDGGGEGKPLGRTVQVIQPKAVDGAVITDPTVAQVVNFRSFEEGDVALLRVADLPKSTVPLTVAEQAPTIGANLTSIGFPASVSQVVDGSRVRASFKTGTVSSNQVGPNGVPGTEINADISPGMSGGPTINDQGQVIGVNSFIVNGESRNFNFITNANDLRTFLKTNNVDLPAPAPSATPAANAVTPKQADSTSSPASLIIGFLVIVLVIAALAGLILFLVLRQRRRRPGPVIAPPAAYPPAGQFTSGQPTTPAGYTPAPPPPAAEHYAPAEAAGSHGATTQAILENPATDYCSNPAHNHPAQGRFCSDCGKPIHPGA